MLINNTNSNSKKMVVSYFSNFGNIYNVVKAPALFLLLVSVLLFSGCATKSAELEYNDMYETRQYQIETQIVTNEIVTTVFIAKYVETNKAVKAEKKVEDFGGYEFEPIGKDINAPTNGIEFQCVDGSCELKER